MQYKIILLINTKLSSNRLFLSKRINQIHMSNPYIKSICQIHMSNSYIKSICQIHMSYERLFLINSYYRTIQHLFCYSIPKALSGNVSKSFKIRTLSRRYHTRFVILGDIINSEI